MIFCKKKEIDNAAVEQFWQWFTEQEQWVLDNLRTNGGEIINAIDTRLKRIFPDFKRELQFQLGGGVDNKWELYFFHLGKKYLIDGAEKLKSTMPEKLQERWTFIVEK